MEAKLKVVEKPKSGTRVLFTLSEKAETGPLLIGTAADAPYYCCGGCGLPLISGVYASQFIDSTQPFHSAIDKIHPVALEAKEHIIGKPLAVKAESVITITKGPLLLTCPSCESINEMLAPNTIGPVQ